MKDIDNICKIALVQAGTICKICKKSLKSEQEETA